MLISLGLNILPGSCVDEALKKKYFIKHSFLLQGDAGIIENEWKFAAMVLDRVCLIAFTCFTVLLSAAVLIAAPHVIVV